MEKWTGKVCLTLKTQEILDCLVTCDNIKLFTTVYRKPKHTDNLTKHLTTLTAYKATSYDKET